MGDRTYVGLTVLGCDAAQVRALLEETYCELSEDDNDGDDSFAFFGFEEVNYGNLEIEDALIAAGIPYSKRWDAGSEYGAGHEHVRFTETGQLQRREVYDEAENPPLDALLALVDDPAALRAFLLAFAAHITPLPWDHQQQYAARYRERQQREQRARRKRAARDAED